jgi:hypothetical protein
MELGFVLDRGHHSQKRVSFWISGRFVPSFWGGIKDYTQREKREIQSFRCTRCGLLRNYATVTRESS